MLNYSKATGDTKQRYSSVPNNWGPNKWGGVHFGQLSNNWGCRIMGEALFGQYSFTHIEISHFMRRTSYEWLGNAVKCRSNKSGVLNNGGGTDLIKNNSWVGGNYSSLKSCHRSINDQVWLF